MPSADGFRAIMAPLAAYSIIMGGGFLLWQVYADPAAGDLKLIVSGLMGSAATFLFGDAVQRRSAESQPTVNMTAGPPARTTITPAVGDQPADPTGGIG